MFLQDELNHINDYISLEKSRFQESLQVRLNIESFDEALRIPPMLLLPFVENAFKHGIQVNGILSVDIELSMDKNNLCFKILNNAIKKENSKNGIGLQNIQKRLKMLFGENYFIEILEKEKKFKVELKIPIRNAE